MFRFHRIIRPLLLTRRRWVIGSGAAALSLTGAVVLDSSKPLQGNLDNYIRDPATSIPFPKILPTPANLKLPTYDLIGVGVRTVSFLGIQVYSVGFYADLSNPDLKIPLSATPEEKIKMLIDNTSCVIRIVPTRTTSFSHLRDGFVRALTARLTALERANAISEEESKAIGFPLRKFRSLFPTTSFPKHESMDIIVSSPLSGTTRTLTILNLGQVESDVLAREFLTAYFDGSGISAPMKKSVVETLDVYGN